MISIHALREEGDPYGWLLLTVTVQFLSTPSARRATLTFALCALDFLHFYPRPPRGGRLPLLTLPGIWCYISIHALREEGDQGTGKPLPGLVGFLSTPSARRATVCRVYRRTGHKYFYPRPPRGGRLTNSSMSNRIVIISIHALREEGDSKNREKTLCFCLIIHLPAQIAKRCLQAKPQNHTVTCANG